MTRSGHVSNRQNWKVRFRRETPNLGDRLFELAFDHVTLYPTTRKPFDVFAEGLDLKNSRGERI